MASRDTISDPVPLTCQPRNTMQRSVVSHVNSIYVARQCPSMQFGRERSRTFMLHWCGLSMPGMLWPSWPWSMCEWSIWRCLSEDKSMVQKTRLERGSRQVSHVASHEHV
jgi:hypothetical protein